MQVQRSAQAEARRLEAVRRYAILDTPPDGTFDRLTSIAARHFGVPISMVSIVDSDRIWLASHHGVDVREIPREPGLCASAIQRHRPWIVEDAALDPRTLANPLVVGELGLRFYVGIPLTTPDGHNLGTFCIIDQRPRTVTDADVAFLSDLAAVVMDQLELRLAARRTAQRERQLRANAEQMARRLQECLLPPELPAVAGADVAALWEPARGEVSGDFYDLFASGDGDAQWSIVLGDVCGKGVDAAAVTALARYTLRAAALQTPDPGEALQLLNDALLRQRPSDERFVTAVYGVAQPVADGVRLLLASAGHVPPLVRRADGRIESHDTTGMPLGLFGDPLVEPTDLALGPGDALLLYTDGVIDARRDAETFGIDRLRRALAETAHLGAAATARHIEALVTRFADGRLTDDTALLVFAVPRP